MKGPSKVRGLATLALLTAGSLDAQSATPAPTGLRVMGGITAGKLLEVAAERPSYFALFAVGRGANGNPVQMLTPASSAELGLRAVKRTAVTPLSPASLGRFAASDEMVIVALASNQAAAFDAFLIEGRPAADLALPDSIVSDGQRLIATLAATVFGPEVQYSGRLMPIEPLTIPLPPNAAMDHCGEIANPPAGGHAFSTKPAHGMAVRGFATSLWMPNDGTTGVVGVVRLPGCSAEVYRVLPPTPLRAPYPPQRTNSAASPPTTQPVPE